MKLREAIQIPLYESFGDLSRVIKSAHNEIFNGGLYNMNNIAINDFTIADNIEDFYNEIIENAHELSTFAKNKEAIPSTRNMRSSMGLAEFLRYLIKHPYVQNNLTVEKDTGWWIRMIRSQETSEGFLDMLARMYSLSKDVLMFESDPNRVKPDMDVITKSQNFEIYMLNNYAAARKICTTFKTNFCIGSNPEMFNAYARDSNRDTYAITLLNRTVVIIHYGKANNGYLVTSNDNNSEFNDKELTRGRGDGILGVFDDFKRAGLDVDDMGYAFSFIMTTTEAREIVSTINNMMTSRETPPTNKGEFEGDPFADFDADDLMQLFQNPQN